MGDLLYHAYSRSSSKPCFLSLFFSLSSSSSDSSCTLCFFIDCFLLQFLTMYSSLSHLKHFLVSLCFFFDQHPFAICPYLSQLKHFGFPSLKFSLDFPMSIGYPCPLYVILVLVLKSFLSSIDLYPWPTNVIATFHSLSDSGAAIGRYPSIVLIMLCHTFFFNRNIVYSLSISVFIVRASNSIIKSTVFCFPCLKVLIFYSTSVAFILLLNVILISLTKLS